MAYEGRRYSSGRTGTGTLIFYAVLLCLPLAIWGIMDYMVTLTFEQECSGHLSRAGHANTIESAEEELSSAVSWLEHKNFTEGYTAIFNGLRTPDEDIGFWYKNLKASLDQLKKLPKDIAPLERSNVLLKLRETLIHHGKTGDDVVHPPGMARYPSNLTWVITLILAGLAAFGGFILGGYALHRDD